MRKSSGSSAEVRSEHLWTTVSKEENHNIHFEEDCWRSEVPSWIWRKSMTEYREELWFGWRIGRELWICSGHARETVVRWGRWSFSNVSQNGNQSLIHPSVYFPQIYRQQRSERRLWNLCLSMQIPQIYKEMTQAWTVSLDSAPKTFFLSYRFKLSQLKGFLTSCLNQFH